MQTQTRQIPKLQTRAAFVPATLNEQDRTVELTWTTGSQVRRFDWWEEREWIEELSLNPEHVRLDRLNNGAPLLESHSSYRLSDVLGVVERAWIDGNEGRAIVKFSQRDDVAPIIADVKAGVLRNISVGYTIHQLEEQEQRQDDLKVFRAVDWEPKEISLVSIPADPGAQVRSEGDNTTVTLIAKEVTHMTEPETETQRTDDEPPAAAEKTSEEVLAIRQQAAKDERDRVAQIRQFAKVAGDRVDEIMIDDLIERGVSVNDAKEQIMKTWSEKVDAETSRSDTSVTVDEKDKFLDAGVSAILGRAGIEKMDTSNAMRGMRLTEIAKSCLSRAGVAFQGMDEREMVKRAFTQSSSDFPVLLENAMHKTLQMAYSTAPDTWTRFCSTGSVTDFRAHNRYRLGSFGNLDALLENGEYKNKSIPDGEKASITADTKGNIINISRKTIINDDLSAFIGLSQMLGRAARRTIEADVYALLASNPVMHDGITLFHADHGNLAASGAVVSVATVEAARVAMAKQTDVSGNDYLDLRPSIWLGGMSSGGTAREVFGAEYNDEASKNQRKPNIVRGLVGDIVDSPRIAGTDWYLFADSADSPVIEVAFLNGEQEPFLDSMEGFSMDGLQWKVRLDYGIAAVDYRGVYKNAGA